MSDVPITYTPERIKEARDRAAMAAMVDVDSFLLALDDIEHLEAEVERLREAIDFVLFNIHPSLTTEDVETIRAEMKRAKQGGAQ